MHIFKEEPPIGRIKQRSAGGGFYRQRNMISGIIGIQALVFYFSKYQRMAGIQAFILDPPFPNFIHAILLILAAAMASGRCPEAALWGNYLALFFQFVDDFGYFIFIDARHLRHVAGAQRLSRLLQRRENYLSIIRHISSFAFDIMLMARKFSKKNLELQ